MPRTPTPNDGMLIALVLILVVVASVLLLVPQAHANGAHVGSLKVFSGPVGPYEATVQTVPVVGDMHLSIYLVQASSGSLAVDATVQVSGRGPRGESGLVSQTSAAATVVQPNLYGVVLAIEDAGEWVFTLEVDGLLGKATVDFPVDVQPPAGINGAVIGALVVLAGLVAWLAFARGRGRRRRAKSRAAR